MKASSNIGDHVARVLIVDDERHNRQLLEVMLTPEGLLLQTASSGEEALAMVAEHPPDLILLDIMMPGMDGYQVAASIKGNVATQNIPVIIITALDDRNAKLRGLSAGAEDFLTKPVDRVELRVRVRNLLSLKAYGDHYDRYSQELEGEVASRMHTEAELRLLAERLSLATSVAKVGVWEWDLQTNALTWDATMFDIYGRPSVVPMPYDRWSDAVCPEDLAAVEATLQRVVDEKSQGSAEYRIMLPNGSVRNVSAVERVVLDDHGRVVRVIGVDMDITERKNAEEALERLRHDQLQFKDDFLSHVSHELRSPLTAIKQFTTILLGGLAGELNKEQREYQQIVLRNIRQLQSMIDDLLEVTRLETGKLTIEPESVSVANAVADTFDTLQGVARTKGVTLTCEVPPDLPSAHADLTRLRQILIILLDNAIKFTPDGGVVTIRGARSPHDPRFLLLEVSDTGCGISPEMVGRIFERLYQGSDPTQTSRKGLGLGLYICRELVTRQGGQIWVNRDQEKGATFSFTLPVFSLNYSLAPLLKNDTWPNESVALVTVETSRRDLQSQHESEDEFIHATRHTLERCLLPNLDVLLPTMTNGAEAHGLRFSVAAFANEQGAAILANRIRDQFERLQKQRGGTATVTYSMLQLPPRQVGASTESIVTSMATYLGKAINSHFTPAPVHHD